MIREYYRQAWKAYKRNWKAFSGTLLVYFIALILVFVAVFIPIAPNFEGVETEEQMIQTFQTSFMNPTFIATIGILMLIVLLSSVAISLGWVQMTKEALTGKTSWKSIMPAVKKNFFTGLKAYILMMIIAVVLAIPLVISFTINIFLAGLLYIVFIVVMIHFSLHQQAIVLDNHGAVASLKKSFKIVNKNFIEFIKLVLGYVIVSMAFGLLDIIGVPIGTILQMLILVPVYMIAYTAFYLDRKTPKKTAKYPKLRRVSRKPKKRRKAKRKARKKPRKRRRQ